MEIRLPSRKFGSMFRLASLWLAAALFIASIAPSWALAQSSNEPWSEPLNLSGSGFASSVGFVIDSDGVGHALWQDDLGEYIYTRFDGEQWSAPVKTELSRLFKPAAAVQSRRPQATVDTDIKPFFVAGPGEYIFAFWLNEEGKLLTSKVRNHSFEQILGWDTVRTVAPSAVSFAVAIDARGELHVVYQSGVDETTTATGIYYTRSKNSGVSWGKAVLLYESPYLRTLAEGEASLSVATVETESVPRIFAAWDNRSRKQVFLTQSADGGETWAETTLVAGPTPDTSLDDPFNIRVGVHDNSILLVWQNGQPAGECSQIFQSSSDGGTTWSDPQLMIDNLLGCTQANNFVPKFATDTKGQLYFLTETKSQTFLSVWDGLQWSQPQAQPMLSGFKEPEIFTRVIFACHQPAVLGERLYVVGCDEGEGGDVWVTSRDVAPNTAGFEPPVWSQASPVASETFKIEAVELAATDDGLIHSVLVQYQDPSVYYTNWDGESWARMTRVLKLPEGEAGWPAIAAGPGDELFLVVPNNRGALYFSRTVSGSALTASGWATPQQLAIGHDGKIGSVDVTRNAAGTVYVAYSIPVNDDRGIYMVLSKDDGKTWSEPLQLFDGTAAGFDFIGTPSLMTSANGSLHITWNVQALQGDGSPQPVALYYTRSQDGGQIFDDAYVLLEEPVVWRALMNDSKGKMHLLWQVQDASATVWDQVSMDGGHSWEYPQGLPVQGELTTLTSDPAGRLHLMYVAAGVLGQWQWDGNGWKAGSSLSLPLSSQRANAAELLTAIVNKQGKMMVVLSKPTDSGDAADRILLYATRSIELPQTQTETKVTPTRTPVAPTLSPNTPAADQSSTTAPTLETEPTNAQTQTATSATSNRISPFTLALLPVALLLLGVLGVMIRQVIRAKDR
jgi:hypothetical protein